MLSGVRAARQPAARGAVAALVGDDGLDARAERDLGLCCATQCQSAVLAGLRALREPRLMDSVRRRRSPSTAVAVASPPNRGRRHADTAANACQAHSHDEAHSLRRGYLAPCRRRPPAPPLRPRASPCRCRLDPGRSGHPQFRTARLILCSEPLIKLRRDAGRLHKPMDDCTAGRALKGKILKG